MAQSTRPAMSVEDEDSTGNRLVVTFLISGLESMVSREVKRLHHDSVLAYGALHQLLPPPGVQEQCDVLSLPYCVLSSQLQLSLCLWDIMLMVILTVKLFLVVWLFQKIFCHISKWQIFLDCSGRS